ncbi:predicted protein [Naegleria gruberi]|uniref:Predicted protein n=1 Tax=Naegleria gruberi TaxID=5762 RepID=D2V352_NAEGR|nr:uncharacterized protein NAEGRDRAFT_63230 [Naegleria gruberi]EFC48716.1 predicted protein [Naegleria gruberi]|eukprot:XP_002681460.1 predicted protein [Naegleria gruberi strain NEG-M]
MSYQVYESGVLPASISTVWPLVSQFDGSPKWSAVVEESTIENSVNPQTIGSIRCLKIRGVSTPAREELIALDQINHTFTYKLLQAGGAFAELQNYTATIKVSEITLTNQTFFEWSVRFNCPAERSEDLTQIVHSAYRGGIQSLIEHLESPKQ